MEKEPITGGEADNDFIRQHSLMILVVVQWVLALLHLYLTFRQRKLLQTLVERPSVLEDLLSIEVYNTSRTYALHKNTFGIIKDIYTNIWNTIFMLCWGSYLSWEWGKHLVAFCGFDPSNELYATAGCVTVMLLYSTIVCDLPCTIYETFVLEHQHKFNNQTPLFFIKDQIIQFLIIYVFLVPSICGTVWIVKNGGDYFVLYMWFFCIATSLLVTVLYPKFIAPLFDKYTPLPEGDLKTRIEQLASSVGFPLYKLYIVEGSIRSSHSNAYLFGFYKYKMIVLYDTLVAEYQKKKAEAQKQKEKDENQDTSENSNKEKEKTDKESRGCETDEIIAVLAHELGHWHYNHAVKNFLNWQIFFLINFMIFAQLFRNASIYGAFGFEDSKPVFVGLVIITTYVIAPVNNLLYWGLTILSRRFEFQADRYALSLGHAEPLKRALVKLTKDNLGFPLYDKLYSNLHNSHPTLLERLDALKKDD